MDFGKTRVHRKITVEINHNKSYITCQGIYTGEVRKLQELKLHVDTQTNHSLPAQGERGRGTRKNIQCRKIKHTTKGVF